MQARAMVIREIRTPPINDPDEENLDKTILENEIHVFLNENRVGNFQPNYEDISSGIDTIEAACKSP
jgi:hypothetical protein